MNIAYKPKQLLAAISWSFLLGSLQVQAGSLAEALDHAWARHPRATAFPALTDAVRASSELAAALTPGPAKLSLSHLSDQVGANQGKEEWEIELATPLWLAGQKSAHIAEATIHGEDLDNQRAALRLELAGELRNAWWGLATARQKLELAGGRLSSARALEVDVLRRYRAGELSRVDANQARAATHAAQNEFLLADAAARESDLSWRTLTGLAGPNLTPPETMPERHGQTAMHPRLAAMESALRTARARLASVQASQRDAPELAVRLLRERGGGNESYASAIGVKLSIPFASGARLGLASAERRAEILQREAELALARQSVQNELDQAWFELDLAEQQRILAQKRHELAADTLALVEKAFRIGESDLSMLLRSRATAFDAEDRLKHQEIAHGKAISRLKQAQGQMP